MNDATFPSWQTMASAPRNGERVLLCLVCDEGVLVGQWHVPDADEIAECADEHEDCHAHPSWLIECTQDIGTDDNYDDDEILGWMPLPVWVKP